jgi:hypothetical protein
MNMRKIVIGRTLYDDYAKRDVFRFIDHTGIWYITSEQAEDMLDDARFMSSRDCIDDIPLKYRKAYARLVDRLEHAGGR